jgi:hypothetical protein
MGAYRHRHRPGTGAEEEREKRSSHPLGVDALLGMQRAAGNQATIDYVRQVQRYTGPETPVTPRSPLARATSWVRSPPTISPSP